MFLLRASAKFFSRQTVSAAKTFSLVFPKQDAPKEVSKDLHLRLGDKQTSMLVKTKQLELNYEHVTEVSTFMQGTRDAVAVYQKQQQMASLWETVKSHLAKHLSEHASALVHMRATDKAHVAGATDETGGHDLFRVCFALSSCVLFDICLLFPVRGEHISLPCPFRGRRS